MPNTRNCGFFNSNTEGDRPYDAEDISQMMTGMVTGGVFPNVGDKFAVRTSGTDVIIGTGKAWWHGKWFENSAEFTISDGASSENNRIDILVIEVNETEEVRDVYFKILEGIPGLEPEEPEIVNEGGVYQLPIAKIVRAAGDVEIAPGNLEYLVGTIRSPWAETALDPNKCIYAYEDETEEVYLENMTLGGTVDMPAINFQAQNNVYYAYVDIRFSKEFNNFPIIVPNIVHPLYLPGNAQVIVGNLSTTSFRLFIYTDFDVRTNPFSYIKVNWMAVGERSI